MGEDGEPTRGYRLVHGGQVLNEFGSRKGLSTMLVSKEIGREHRLVK